MTYFDHHLKILHCHDIMPRTRAYSGQPPLEMRRSQRVTIQPQVLAGSILWLPEKDDIDPRLLTGVEIDDGCFHHPVVILSTNLEDGKATVLIVSTGAQNLRICFQKDSTDIRSSLLSTAKISKRSIPKTTISEPAISQYFPLPLTPIIASSCPSPATSSSGREPT